MDSKIKTFLMFEGEAEEAVNFYVSFFEDSEIIRMTHYGAGGAGKEGRVARPLDKYIWPPIVR